MKDIDDAVDKLDVEDIIQEAKNMGIEVVSESPYKTHTIKIDGRVVPLETKRHLTFDEKTEWEGILDKLHDAINLLDIIEDSVEPITYLDIYYDGMELLYEFRKELDGYLKELNKEE